MNMYEYPETSLNGSCNSLGMSLTLFDRYIDYEACILLKESRLGTVLWWTVLKATPCLA